MRGNRTWLALVFNWLLIGGLLIAGGFHPGIVCAALAVIVASLVIVSGEMKWWKDDLQNLKTAEQQLIFTGKQLATYREAIRQAPVVDITKPEK